MLPEAVQSLLDPGIATLPAILDPLELCRRLGASSWPLCRSATPEEVRVGVLTHHPGSRCTVEIALRTADGWREFIGKVYAVERSDVFQAMQQICQAGFGPEAEFSIPEPVAYVPALRLLLQEKVEGPRARDVFVTGNDRECAAAAERCALWLARFQTATLEPHSVFRLNDYLTSLERWSSRIAGLGRPLAERALGLFERLLAASPAIDSTEASPGHGSYSAGQVILSPGRTVTFDWDGFDRADPARDAARFIVALRRLALGRLRSTRALDDAAEIFQKTYLASAPPGAKERLPFYKAAACLQLAKYNLDHRVHRWEQKLEAMLQEGFRCLEGEG